MSYPELKVGQIWQRRDGNILKVESVEPAANGTTSTSVNGYYYQPVPHYGGFHVVDSARHLDLVELLHAPEEPATEPWIARGFMSLHEFSGRLYAVATDGTGWVLARGSLSHWEPLPPLPQD